MALLSDLKEGKALREMRQGLSADAPFLLKIFAALVAASVLASSVSGIGAVRVMTQRPAQVDAKSP